MRGEVKGMDVKKTVTVEQKRNERLICYLWVIVLDGKTRDHIPILVVRGND